jgi:molybdate transport system ATP-binding protein
VTIRCEIVANRGDFRIEARFESGARIVAVEGASGAGKTTLLHAIAGLIPVETGRFVVDGETILDAGSGQMPPPHRRRIGYVFQDARLFPHLTVAENIDYGRRFAGRSLEIGPILNLLGLEPLLGRWTRNLSGGEVRRVAIARALASDPRLLLLDEPFAGLDGPRRDELLPWLAALRDETALPMLLVSHDPRDAGRLADDRVVMVDGRIDRPLDPDCLG